MSWLLYSSTLLCDFLYFCFCVLLFSFFLGVPPALIHGLRCVKEVLCTQLYPESSPIVVLFRIVIKLVFNSCPSYPASTSQMQGLQACATVAVHGPEAPTLELWKLHEHSTNSATSQPLKFPKLRLAYRWSIWKCISHYPIPILLVPHVLKFLIRLSHLSSSVSVCIVFWVITQIFFTAHYFCLQFVCVYGGESCMCSIFVFMWMYACICASVHMVGRVRHWVASLNLFFLLPPLFPSSLLLSFSFLSVLGQGLLYSWLA